MLNSSETMTRRRFQGQSSAGTGKGELMNVVRSGIRWIMLAAGASTCTMVYAAIAPQAALRSAFGEALDGPVAEIVVRNWGAVITLVGVMLIWGAIKPHVRTVALVVAGASKLVFIGLVLSHGSR